MVRRYSLLEKLDSFINKHYQNLLVKGLLYFFSLSLVAFIFLSTLEHFVNGGVTIRTVLFWSFIIINGYLFYRWVFIPVRGLLRWGQVLSYDEAAKIIGQHFPEIDDKLLNLLQLQQLNQSQSELLEASILKRTEELSLTNFKLAIDFRKNLKYVPFLAAPIGIVLIFIISGNKNILNDGSARIIAYNEKFTPQAPFDFIINNQELKCLKGADFTLEMHFEGNRIPKDARIIIGEQSYQMKKETKSHFSFLFKNPQKTSSFYLEAQGFYSKKLTLTVLPKPVIDYFEIIITPPSYTSLQPEKLTNKGNVQLPIGSSIQWKLNTEHTEEIYFKFEKKEKVKRTGSNEFMFQKRAYENDDYGIFTRSDANVVDSMFYRIQIIADQFPEIVVNESIDSANNMLRFIQGSIKDDYGFEHLYFNYRMLNDSSQWVKNEESINKSTVQGFSKTINLLELGLTPGEGVEYYFEVFDNDQVNGSKSTRSITKTYNAPSFEELEEQANDNKEEIKSNLENTLSLAKELKEDFKELKEQLIKNKELSWEDKEKAQEILKKQEQLKNELDKITQENQINNQNENQFNKPNEELLKKQEEVQKLFENIMTSEMKEMMNQLNEMMNEVDKKELQQMMEQLEQNDEDVEKELDRTLELFKQLELEQKLQKNIDKLRSLAEKQRQLSKKTEEKNQDPEALQKEQEELKKDFENIQEDLKKAQKLNEKLENKQQLADTKAEEEAIKEDMKNSVEQLQKKLIKQSSKSQKKAADKMEEMSDKLQSAMEMESSEGVAEDMETLRQILENLITLSKEEESLLINIGEVKYNSPIYTDYIKTQKKLQLDAQIVEDSLFALSKRQPQISSFINVEINDLNINMEKAIGLMEERQSQEASVRQQYAMTSANNLALLLSEVLEQMQKQMANKSDKPSSKMCNRPKSNGGESMKKMKQMQKELSEKMSKMLKEGKSDKQGQKGKMSKEIAKMAAQQEMIRKRMGQIREEMSGDEGAKKNIDKMMQQMEETESDIINRKISEETIRRQEQILERLLEAEKAKREKDQDNKRESQEWFDQLSKRLLNPFEEYQKEKEKQEEMLRTVPPSMTPFYKNKVNDYFKNDIN